MSHPKSISTPAHGLEPAAAVVMVERYLRDYLAELNLPSNLRDAVAYSLLGPGKRLRPILALAACEAVGGAPEKALPAAGAVELIHCFSLVHDDLPAMDNDDLRRGRPTLHRHAGQAMAILAGDLMVSLAFGLLAQRIQPPAHAVGISRELAGATDAMISGQVYDTLGGFDETAAPADRLRLIHRHKTAALIRASVRMGAMAGGATPEALAALTRYGEDLGIMFQIVDDLLDVTQTTAHLGKTAGKDVVQEKLTWPGIFGIPASQEAVVRLGQEAHSALAGLGPHAVRLHELCDLLAQRTR